MLALDKQLAITLQTIKSRTSNVTTMKAIKEGVKVTCAGDQLQKFQAVVNLYRAIGGGWK